MKEHIEKILELCLAITLITAALASVYRMTAAVGSMIEKNYDNKRHISSEFSPKAKLIPSPDDEEEVTKRLDKYHLASEFKRMSEIEAEKQYVVIDGVKINLTKEEDSEGIENNRGEKLGAGDLRLMLDMIMKEKIEFYFKEGKVSKMKLQ